MRRLSVLTAFCLAACGDNLTAPIDAKFRTNVEGPGLPAGAVVSVDVLWRGDGAVNITLDDPDGVVPGPRALPAVLLQDGGAVAMRGPVARWTGAKPDQVDLSGFIAPDVFELDLSDTPPGATAASSVHLRGEARPLGDTDALDGEYLVATTHFPSWCPSDPGPSEPGRNLRLDVLPSGAGARFEIDGDYAFTAPIAGGNVAWAGPVRVIGDGSTFPASASGTVLPDGVALAFDEPDASLGSGCADRHLLTGSKWLPDSASLGGDYRAMFDWTDECDGTKGRFADVIRVVPQTGGSYDFFDPMAWLQFDLVPGQAFSGDFVDVFGSGAVIHYEGLSDPPRLSYTATYEYPFDPPCVLTLKAEAYKRYFFPSDGK